MSFDHFRKTHVELVKEKQKVHQTHAISDENLQVKNQCHLVCKQGCLNVNPIFHPTIIK
jgi:hypothetical protein